MTYPTVDASENPREPVAPLAAQPTASERLRAGLMLAGPLSLAAVFWIAVIRLVA